MIQKWKLLEPIKIGTVSLRNRIVIPPMESRLSRPDGSVTRAMIDYYAERAKGGAGAIIVENTFVDDKESRSSLSSSGLYSDHLIAGKSELAEAIKANGAVALIQLGHGGRECHPEATRRQPVAPSAVPCEIIGVVPREMTIDKIEEVQNAFAEAARRAKQAGFDGVEIHGAHGYLICSFLSPYTNKRTDKYGGSLKNRALFPLEVISKVREKVGNNFIVGYRMSADEYVPGGLTLDETSQFAKMLEEVDYINVSAGIYESGYHIVQPPYIEKAHLVHLAEGIKKVVSTPVITVGAHDIYTAEEALQKGKADLVALGRTLIADPELPKKMAEGRIEDIRPCIRGNEGCISRFDTAETMRCEVNPACGRESYFRITTVEKRKRVVVIGGGIAGIQAALDIANGQVLTECKPRHRHQEFMAFLRLIDKQVPDELDVHIIADNYASHKHPKIKGWLARNERFHMHFTPTYSSWLNQVERWFGLITDRAIRRGSFSSVKELTAKINTFVTVWNNDSTPFVWHATAASILEKIARLCTRISGTGH